MIAGWANSLPLTGFHSLGTQGILEHNPASPSMSTQCHCIEAEGGAPAHETVAAPLRQCWVADVEHSQCQPRMVGAGNSPLRFGVGIGGRQGGRVGPGRVWEMAERPYPNLLGEAPIRAMQSPDLGR